MFDRAFVCCHFAWFTKPGYPRLGSRSDCGQRADPLIVGFFALGIAYFVQELLDGFQPSFVESVYAALTVLGTVILVMMMGIRKKLAAYSLATKSGEVIVVDFQANGQDKGPVNSPSDYRKAA